jgi:hypothetical protein
MDGALAASCVIGVLVDAKDAALLRGPVARGLAHAHGYRDLAEDLAGATLAEHAILAIDDLDPALDHAEQRSFGADMGDIFAGAQHDLARDTDEPVARHRVEAGESLEPPDLLFGQHARRSPSAQDHTCQIVVPQLKSWPASETRVPGRSRPFGDGPPIAALPQVRIGVQVSAEMERRAR